MENDSLGSDICCPECGEISDSYEAFTDGGGGDGATPCPYCHASIADEDWISD